jgi:Kef-type K+ transport system membrane component KefB
MENSFFQQLIREFRTPLTNPVLIFSLILLIILLSPIVLKKLNIPGIIGLIISGVVIGPHGLNILAKNSAIDLFSTIGLLYIMFIAGLELDMKEFQKHKNKSLVFGLFTFILPLSLGFPVCYYLLKYQINSSFLTASMFATHTLVAYPIVSRFGISKNKAVAITVGGTILTDTAVLLILAVVLGSANGSLNHEFWLRMGTSLAIFSVIMFFGVPRMAKWFFRKLESEKTSHYIFVLSVVFFSAFLAQVAGVEPIIGAFVAGLVLNKLIPHSSALMNRIEFIGNAIFIPFFLISVGMLVDIRVILKGPTALIVAGALTVTALVGKWLAALLMQKVFRYTRTERQLIFGLSAAHAAATLAIILIGYKEGILDENILNGTIILILITCLTASFVTENAAKKMVIDTDMEILPDAVTDSQQEHILLPVEDYRKIEPMLELAVFIKDKRSPNPITLLSIVPNNDETEKNLLIARKNMEDIQRLASATDTNINTIASIDYNAASGTIRTAKEIMADTILLEWPERSSILDRVFGERTENILAGADKNVFI